MQNIPVAPSDFALPKGVLASVRGAQSPIAQHGFGRSVIGPDWWNERLAQRHLRQHVALRDHDGVEMLTRGDIFPLGVAARKVDASDDLVLTFVWHVLAWGTGSSQRGNARRIASLTDTATAETNLGLIRAALALAGEGDPAGAYRTLIRRGGGKIRGLGPAFFTKLLYFASEEVHGHRCLILDARVASSLARAGWSSLPRVRGTYSYNWHTPTYASYCNLLERWSEEASEALGRQVRPDEVERALFEGAS